MMHKQFALHHAQQNKPQSTVKNLWMSGIFQHACQHHQQMGGVGMRGETSRAVCGKCGAGKYRVR